MAHDWAVVHKVYMGEKRPQDVRFFYPLFIRKNDECPKSCLLTK